MPVSPATETKLRVAMQRLLNGTPQHTDGALTKENLAREAAVSHATVHRAETILAAWNTRVGKPSVRDAPSVPAEDTVTQLRAALRDASQKITTSTAGSTPSPPLPPTSTARTRALSAALDHRTLLAPLPSKEPG
jgi:DNA-binding transcriptional MocR family regulator